MPPLPLNIPPFQGPTIGPIAVRSTLADRTIVSFGSGVQNIISGNPARNYLFFQNLNAFPISVNPTGGLAALNGSGCVQLANLGTLVYESSFIPSGPIAVTGQSSAGGCIVLEG